MAPWKKVLVSLFVLFHLVAVATWNLPDGTAVKRLLWDRVQLYMFTMGMWQAWNMFAPNPSNLNLFVHAHVVNSDQTTWDYEMPRMDKLGYVERYRQERFRKYIENVHLDDFRMFWPDMARWIAQQDKLQTGKTAIHIDLLRTWWEVPGMPSDPTETPSAMWSTYRFYSVDMVNGEIRR